jgi:hypothetical protein
MPAPWREGDEVRTVQRASLLALTLTLLAGLDPLKASELSFPEHGFSLNLPGEWRIGDQSIVEDMNAMMKADPRTAKVQYYRIIYPSNPDPDEKLFPTYILVQIVDAPISPELFAKLFPSIARGMQKATDVVKDVTNLEVTMGKPVYDAKTRTGLTAHSGVDGEGLKFKGMSVTIPTTKNMICLHVYADEINADAVFPEVVPALQAASLQREVAMTDDWNAAIEKLLKTKTAEGD